jgi:hypothetical protein
MRKSTRRRPEVETLETLILLSTVVASVHQAAPTGPVQLEGTFRLRPERLPAGPGSIVGSEGLAGSGNLGEFGRVEVVVEGMPIATPGFLIALDGRRGYLALATQLTPPGRGATASAPYAAIDGDGGPIDQVNPTGTVTITASPFKAGKPSYILKLS